MTRRTRLILELEPGVEPITGSLQVGAAPQESFTGWLELVALLELERSSGDGGSSVTHR